MLSKPRLRSGMVRAALVAPLLLVAAGCRQDMHNQPRYKPLAASDFFGDGRSARPVLEGTVARGHMRLDAPRYTGKVGGADITEFPFPITRADIGRGEERFNIYCSPCHGKTGDGRGLVVRRGFRLAANYHTERLRRAPIGHFFDVITNGFGAMASYASRVPVDDRWRIIAYIRALQYSQAATAADVPAEVAGKLDQAGTNGVMPDGQLAGPLANPDQRGIGAGPIPAEPGSAARPAVAPPTVAPNPAVQSNEGQQAPVPAPARRGLDSHGAGKQTK